MGQYLSSPNTEKEVESGETEHLVYGVSSQQGWRRTQEDAHISQNLEGHYFLLGIFDGHGGSEVAKFCSTSLPEELRKHKLFGKKDQVEELLTSIFHRMDELMLSDEGRAQLEILRARPRLEEGGGDDVSRVLIPKLISPEALANGNAAAVSSGEQGGPGGVSMAEDEAQQAGCTAVVALVHHEVMYVANAGDSRAVLARKRAQAADQGGAGPPSPGCVAVPMSYDHKPSHPTEKERIIAAGGFVSEIGGISRVNGNLSLSRAIGDLRYKQNADLMPAAQMVTAEPDVKRVDVSPDDQFLVMACDGIWDCMENQEVVDFIYERLQQGKHPTDIASELLDSCIAPDPKETRGVGCDNMTCAILVFKHAKQCYA